MLTFCQTPAYRNAMNEAKKRIALAVTLAEPGGVQSFLLELAHHLVQDGHEVTVIAGDGQWLEQKLLGTPIHFLRLKHMHRSIHATKDLLAIFELTRIFQANKFDAVHLNSSKMGIIGSIAARIAKIPRTVYRIGGWVFLEPLSTWRKNLYIRLERWTARFKDSIICVHPGDVEVAKRFGIKPKKELIAIPNGIRFDAFEQNLKSRNDARHELNLPLDTFIFGTVANFYPVKNIPGYLEACAEFKQTHPVSLFIIMGDGPEYALIEERIKELDLQDHVILTGNRDNASELLRAFDAFVLPSTKEGMSWSLLEAMATGLPCIATDVGAARWMLEPNSGMIVTPKNSTQLAEAMSRIADDVAFRDQLGQNAKKAVRDRFPLEETLAGNVRSLLD